MIIDISPEAVKKVNHGKTLDKIMQNEMVPRLEPENVFTPSAPAIDSLVYTRRRRPETTLSDILKEQGTQVLLYGGGTVGKTSFILTELRHHEIPHIRIQCEGKTSWKTIVDDLMRKLKIALKVREVSTQELSPEISTDIYVLKGRFGA